IYSAHSLWSGWIVGCSETSNLTMRVDSHANFEESTPHRSSIAPVMSTRCSTPKPSRLELQQTANALVERGNNCGQEALSTDQSMWRPVMTAFPQAIAQPFGTQVPHSQPIYVVPAAIPMQHLSTAAHPAIPSDPNGMMSPIPLPYGHQIPQMATSPFRCEVPPPGYSPPTLAAPPSFNYPPPSVCGCTMASVPMPASFSLQHAHPASATFFHVQAAGRVPVPVGGLVPVSGASIPVGEVPVPLMYNICTPMMDQQQPYAMSVCSSAVHSTVVSQETEQVIEQNGGARKQSYVKFSHEETLRHSTVQKPLNTAYSTKNRKEKVNPKYKTKPCNKFSEKGSCPYGQACQFIHEMPSNNMKETTTSATAVKAKKEKVDRTTQTLSPESTSESSLTQLSNEMASRLYSSTPVCLPGRRFRQLSELGNDPRIPPGKSVSYLHNFSAGHRKPHVIDGLHSMPLTRGVTSDHE
uniref:C3H1-type domain-containing protein n=1 Tax=Parascaris univalens TaxID=6257 RepID=A0A915B3Z8_PARUN